MLLDTKEIAVLVADSDLDELSHVLRLLREIGLSRITSANDGHNALIQLKKNPFQLALLGWDLPRLSALEILAHLKKIPRFPIPGIILLASSVDRDDADRAAAEGIGDFLVKPFNAGILQKKIEKILDVRFA
jgi:PleD family two-component response regulator